jgi:hypothetical protein
VSDSGIERADGSSRLAVGALLGACGLALLAARAAEAGGELGTGLTGRLLARADVAAIVVVAALAFLVAGPYARAHIAGRSAPDGLAVGRRQLAWLYAAWWPMVLANQVLVDPSIGPRRLVLTLVLFRDPGTAGPLAGLSIGWVLFVVATAIVVMPWWAAAARRLGAGPARGRSPVAGWVVIGLLGAVLAIGVRAVTIASGATEPFGALSWLPAHLDAVGAGAAAAAFAAAVQHHPTRRNVRAVRSVAAGIGAAAMAVAVLGAGLPRALLVTDAGDQHVRALLYAVAASAAVVAMLVGHRPLARPARALAFASPGLLLAGESAFVVLARQYRERVTGGPLGLRFVGPVLPVWLWSACLAAGLGVATVVGVLLPLWRHFTGTWGRPEHVYRLGLAGLVAAGFLVRVGAWLALAPEKTDGGDPLFYHVTANVLAQGRGFPEPLNWLDGARHVPSALHGPLYPVALSLSSRLGGTTYVDHKFASILIGTATVLMTARVARRLGGRVAGLFAAALAALYPNLWMIDGLMFPEGLFALLTTSCILAAYRWYDRPRLFTAAVLGGLIGLAALTRGEGLLLAPLLVVPWFLRRRGLTRRHRWTHLVVAGTACVAVLAPWTIRNAVTFEEFVPLSTNGNELLMYANCDDSYHGRLIGYWSFDCQVRHRRELGEPPGDESQKARYWRDVGVRYARDHLTEVPGVVAVRVLRQWELYKPWQTVEFSTIEGRQKGPAALGVGMYYVLGAASVAGVVQLRRRQVPLLPLAAQAIGVTLTAAYAYGTVRFRAPMEPVLCVLAGVAAVPGLAWTRRKLAPVDDPPIADGTAFVLGGSGGLRFRRAGAVRSWLGIGAVLAAVAIPLGGLYHSTGGTMEEAFMIYFPERLGKGDVPNVDFLHLYGPGSLHVLLGWFKVFGFNLEAERTFALVQHLGIIFGLYALARAWGRAAATAVGVLSTLLVLTPIGLTAMAWNGGLALVVWSVVLAVRAIALGDRRRCRRTWVTSGVLAGLALTYRPDLGLALLLASGWLLWRRGDWRRFALGAAVGLTPMWVHLAMAGPHASFEGMFIDPVFRLRAGRELPRPPSWDRLDGSLQAIAETVPPWWRLPALSASVSLFVWFFAMLLGCVALLLVARRLYSRTGGAPRSLVLMAGALIGIGVLPQALQRPDSTHLSWVTCISWPLFVPAIVEIVRHRSPRTHPRLRVLIGAGALAATMFVVSPLFTYRYYLQYARMSIGDVPGPYPVSRDGRRFYLGDVGPYRATRDAVELLDGLVRPGERLFVGPQDLRRTWYSDVYFYYLFPELEPATYFIEMDPGLANAEGSRLADDLRSADWVILTRFWDGWYEPNASMDYGSGEPNEVIATDFCVVDEFERLVTVYRRCEAS